MGVSSPWSIKRDMEDKMVNNIQKDPSKENKESDNDINLISDVTREIYDNLIKTGIEVNDSDLLNNYCLVSGKDIEGNISKILSRKETAGKIINERKKYGWNPSIFAKEIHPITDIYNKLGSKENSRKNKTIHDHKNEHFDHKLFMDSEIIGSDEKFLVQDMEEIDKYTNSLPLSTHLSEIEEDLSIGELSDVIETNKTLNMISTIDTSFSVVPSNEKMIENEVENKEEDPKENENELKETNKKFEQEDLKEIENEVENEIENEVDKQNEKLNEKLNEKVNEKDNNIMKESIILSTITEKENPTSNEITNDVKQVKRKIMDFENDENIEHVIFPIYLHPMDKFTRVHLDKIILQLKPRTCHLEALWKRRIGCGKVHRLTEDAVFLYYLA